MWKAEWMLRNIVIFGSIFMPIMSYECLHGVAKNGDTSTLSVKSQCEAGCGIFTNTDQCKYECGLTNRTWYWCRSKDNCHLDINVFEKKTRSFRPQFQKQLSYCLAVGRSSSEYIKWKKNQTATVNTGNLDCLDGQSMDGNATEITIKSNCSSCYVSVMSEHHWFYRCLDFDAGEDCWPEGECMCSSSSNCNLDFNIFENLVHGFNNETSARIMESTELGKNTSAYIEWEQNQTTIAPPTTTPVDCPRTKRTPRILVQKAEFKGEGWSKLNQRLAAGKKRQMEKLKKRSSFKWWHIIPILQIIFFVAVVILVVWSFFTKEKRSAAVIAKCERKKRIKNPKDVVMEVLPDHEIQKKGPLHLQKEMKGEMKHQLDGKKSHSIHEKIEFDPTMNEEVQIGSDVEIIDGMDATTTRDDSQSGFSNSNTVRPVQSRTKTARK